MRWSRPIGLGVVAIMGFLLVGALAQLVASALDHGAIPPTLALLVAAVAVGVRLGTGGSTPAPNPYW